MPVVIPRDENPSKHQVQASPEDEIETMQKRLQLASAARAWATAFQSAVDNKDVDKVVNLFSEDGWYRDLLVIDHGDFNSFPKSALKQAFHKHQLPPIHNLSIIRPAECRVVTVDGITWLQAFLVYETKDTRGKGFLRLKQDEHGSFKQAFSLFLTLWEIKGHEEFAFSRRPHGAGIHNGDVPVEQKEIETWRELRDKEVLFENSDPTVLIVGGGQGGVFLAARLRAIGIPVLIIDKNDRVGDNWRNRYKSLVLHDPVHSDHFPYLPYPPNWPKYTPKDKLADWFVAYADAMELNWWGNTTLKGDAEYDEKTQKWRVTVDRKGHPPREMNVSHLVIATGFSGHPRMPNFKGKDSFKGPMMHASRFQSAEGWQGKKAVVVGACNTGHDIAEDFYAHGADVTLVQRSHTYVASSKHGLPAWLDGFYEEGGPPIDDADLMFSSLPIALIEQFHQSTTREVFEKDKETLEGLEKAGFKVNRYSAGLFMKLFIDGGGYYLDVGASKMIADGKIKIKQGQEIEEVLPNGLRFADGTTLDADIIVLATGYSSMRDSIRDIVGDKVASALPTLWNLDCQRELHTMWRNTGLPGFWLMGGNMFQSRVFSRPLALQMLLIERGLLDKKREYPKEKEIPDSRY